MFIMKKHWHPDYTVFIVRMSNVVERIGHNHENENDIIIVVVYIDSGDIFAY